MQVSSWARTRSPSQWWIGRRSRSSPLMERKSRSTRERLLQAVTVQGASSASAETGSDDVDAVEGGLGADGGLVALVGQVALADVGALCPARTPKGRWWPGTSSRRARPALATSAP